MTTTSNQHNLNTHFNAATSNGTSSVYELPYGNNVAQAFVTGTGAVTATCQIYGNMTSSTTNGVLLATIILNNTTSDSAGGVINGPWPYIYGVLSNLTGTGAAFTLSIGA